MHQKTQMLGSWKGVVKASSYAPLPSLLVTEDILLTFLVFVNRTETSDAALPARLFDLFWKQDEGATEPDSSCQSRLRPTLSAEYDPVRRAKN
jgi:hypothetical protein